MCEVDYWTIYFFLGGGMSHTGALMSDGEGGVISESTT